MGQTHIEGKCHPGVGEQDQEANTVQSVEWLETFDKGQDDEVDGGAHGGVIVQRHDRVHLE